MAVWPEGKHFVAAVWAPFIDAVFEGISDAQSKGGEFAELDGALPSLFKRVKPAAVPGKTNFKVSPAASMPSFAHAVPGLDPKETASAQTRTGIGPRHERSGSYMNAGPANAQRFCQNLARTAV